MNPCSVVYLIIDVPNFFCAKCSIIHLYYWISIYTVEELLHEARKSCFFIQNILRALSSTKINSNCTIQTWLGFITCIKPLSDWCLQPSLFSLSALIVTFEFVKYLYQIAGVQLHYEISKFYTRIWSYLPSALTKLYDELFVPNSGLNDINVDLHSFSRMFFESFLLTE